MHTFLIAILSALHVGMSTGRHNAVSFITGGNKTTTATQFPYHVLVVKAGGQEGSFLLCSGAIINTTHVVTSASALESSSVNSIQVATGSNEFMGDDAAVSAVKSYKIHENYSSTTNDNDIALIQVDTPFIFSNTTQPVSISPNWTVDPSETCIISSFAEPNFDPYNPDFEWVYISTVNCSGESKPSDNLFCAGDNTSTEQIITSADKGSPMVCNSTLVGIVTNSSLGYLTNISKYYDWIFPPVQPSSNSTTNATSASPMTNTTSASPMTNTTTAPPMTNTTTTTSAPGPTDESSLSNNIIFYSVIVLTVVISIGLVFIIVKCLVARI